MSCVQERQGDLKFDLNLLVFLNFAYVLAVVSYRFQDCCQRFDTDGDV